MSQLECLTIYLAEGDRWRGRLLYQSLMKVARSQKIAGMTVIGGAVGYGKRNHHSISADWIVELATYLPIVVIVVDSVDAIAAFLTQIESRIKDEIVMHRMVEVVHQTPTSPEVAQFSQPQQFAAVTPLKEAGMADFEQLTIYIRESEQWHSKPIYLVLVEEARKSGLVGVTVIRGITGYGKRNLRHVKLFGIVELFSDLPMLVTIVDRSDAISQFLLKVQEITVGSLVTREPISVIYHAPVLK